ncbi:DNA-binding protein [Pseudoduganella chitinolytica]|uniref:DNA-binding protein n=1 Tax=Pseudoduganella chitinolytica TaxID=34070 RepID=A0ABY8BGS0_9BURK|nr:DNA-binding protein [Pseudoduganella chitinolytica]WEF34168.1 DNA-binding protein [Pseudoduganella chitinolytica]
MPDAIPTYEEVAEAAARLREEGSPVTIDAVREMVGSGSAAAILRHLAAWREAEQPMPAPPSATIPPELATALTDWARRHAEEAGAGAREALERARGDIEELLRSGDEIEFERNQAQAVNAEQAEQIEQLTVELRDARRVATEALVSKAKDQLAIDGKERQINDLRQQLERNVTASAADSDARLAAEMELVGAVTARDEFASEIKQLRQQLDAVKAERATLRAEMDALRGRRQQ